MSVSPRLEVPTPLAPSHLLSGLAGRRLGVDTSVLPIPDNPVCQGPRAGKRSRWGCRPSGDPPQKPRPPPRGGLRAPEETYPLHMPAPSVPAAARRRRSHPGPAAPPLPWAGHVAEGWPEDTCPPRPSTPDRLARPQVPASQGVCRRDSSATPTRPPAPPPFTQPERPLL